jgi:hypothetical protein
LAAKHFDESDSDYYFFFEDDMTLNPPHDRIYCRNGFRKFVPGLYKTVHEIMAKEQYDFLKLSFTEVYMDNNIQVSWYNVPQTVRTEMWPEYDKLPISGLDPNAPRTKFSTINILNGLAYINGDIYYAHWPMIVGKQGNRKMFLDVTWEHPYEQTWMSYMFQETIIGNISLPGLNASISASYGKYTGNITGTNIKPIRTSSINSSYGKYTGTVTATNVKPIRTATVNSSYGKYTGSINAGLVTSVRQTNINASYGKYTGTINGSNVKPVLSVGINSSYSKYTGSVTASNIKPLLITSINSNYGKHTASISIDSLYLDRTVTINSNYPKYSGSINVSLLSTNRSCTINGSYPKYFAVVVQGEVNLTTKAGTGRNLDISFGSRNYQYYAGLRDITVEV